MRDAEEARKAAEELHEEVEKAAEEVAKAEAEAKSAAEQKAVEEQKQAVAAKSAWARATDRVVEANKAKADAEDAAAVLLSAPAPSVVPSGSCAASAAISAAIIWTTLSAVRKFQPASVRSGLFSGMHSNCTVHGNS